MRFLVLLLALAVSCLTMSGGFIVPPSQLGGSVYPDWAHHHWVWLSNEVANQTSETTFVQGFLDRNIPVGAVDIDSTWSTGINNFVWNDKYPTPADMIEHFHSLNIRVICWATSVIDTDSPSYAEGKAKNYYLNDGRTVKWWHGHGSFIDYTNPEAVEWWHNQMDNPLNMGLDGFKTDGTDPYTLEFVIIEGKGGIITYRDYADMYYGDFFNYSRVKNPDSLIMSRPVDSYDMIYWKFSPRYTVFSGWVGDQDPNFSGLQDALRNMFHSAWAHYVGFGSDIGGYRHGPGEFGRTKTLFIRWAQMGAFCSLMENGGEGQHRPWEYDSTNQTLDIYRTFVNIHMELNPYLLSAGNTAWNTDGSIMIPLARETIFTPDTWDYLLWHDVLVCPMVDNGTTRNITFPQGSNWVDWWNHSRVFQAGSKVQYETPLEILPTFHRQASFIPLNVTQRIQGGHGDEGCNGALTLFLPHPDPAVSQRERVPVYEWRAGPTQELSYTWSPTNDSMIIEATAHGRPILIHMVGVHAPRKVVFVQQGGNIKKEARHQEPWTSVAHLRAPQDTAWAWNKEGSRLWIHIPHTKLGASLRVHW